MRALSWSLGGLLVTTAALTLHFGCGGKAVVDTESSNSGGSGGTGPGSTSAGPSTGAGSTVCTTHDQCAPGLCIFSTGQCATACDAFGCESCPAGEVCGECATSSCPECLDCMSACVPATNGRCDDHDDCGGEVCIFGAGPDGTGVCAPSCDGGGCADPSMVCDECATGSCPCCRDCQAACVVL